MPEAEHAAWQKRWETIFGVSFTREVSKVRQRWNRVKLESAEHEKPNQGAFVYLVHHHAYGGWIDSSDAEAGILATYNNLPAANEHAMAYFSDHHPDQVEFGNFQDMDNKDYDDSSETGWNMHDDGCLELLADNGKHGLSEIKVIKQAIWDQPPKAKSDNYWN